MIFAHKNYKEIKLKDCKSWNEWCELIRVDQKYCSKFNQIKWFWFHVWYLLGRFNPNNLSSWHPHWKLMVLEDVNKSLIELKEKYEICLNDSEKIKYLFNSTTTLESIEQMIKDKQIKLKEYAL